MSSGIRGPLAFPPPYTHLWGTYRRNGSYLAIRREPRRAITAKGMVGVGDP